MKKRKLVLISMDAMVKEDFEYLLTKPFFRSLFEQGSWIKTLRTIYPSVTYPCHAAMITGCYPDKTGVYNNELNEYRSRLWHWSRADIKVKTLVDAAKERGYTVGNVFWPVMSNDPHIDYNIPECWSMTPEDGFREAMQRHGVLDRVFDDIIEPNRHLIEGHQRQSPYCDEFVYSCGRDMILKYNPDLLLMHPCNLDSTRHRHGVFNAYTTASLDLTCYWIEKIVWALQTIGEWENTDLVITSDHGQIDICRTCNPNRVLEKAGLIALDETGKATNMRAYARGVGASAQVFVTDKSAYDETYRVLCEAAKSGLYGFEHCYTRDEIAQKEHLSGDFDFVLETDGYTSFGDGIGEQYFTNFDTTDYRTGRATHGHLPDKGPQPTMLLVGPDFKAGVHIERRSTLDTAPTLARVLGLSLPDADGRVIEEILV